MMADRALGHPHLHRATLPTCGSREPYPRRTVDVICNEKPRQEQPDGADFIQSPAAGPTAAEARIIAWSKMNFKQKLADMEKEDRRRKGRRR